MSRFFSMERVPGPGCLDHVAAHDLEVQIELVVELLLPLLDQAARGDDQAAVEVAAQHELADVEARHDRLAGARVVGQQEAERLQRQEALVDGLDLVGERLDGGGLDGGERVEEVGQLDPAGLGGQLECGAVGVEGPAAARWPPQRRSSLFGGERAGPRSGRRRAR